MTNQTLAVRANAPCHARPCNCSGHGWYCLVIAGWMLIACLATNTLAQGLNPGSPTAAPAIRSPFDRSQAGLPRLPGQQPDALAPPQRLPDFDQNLSPPARQTGDPAETLELGVGTSYRLLLAAAPARVIIGHEEIASVALVDRKELVLVGKRPGSTMLTLWLPGPGDGTKVSPRRYVVHVGQATQQTDRGITTTARAQPGKGPVQTPGTQPPNPEASGQPAPPADTITMPRVPPFGPYQTRLPRLPGQPAPFGSTPKPSPEVQKEYSQYVQRMVDPQETLDLVVGRARLIILSDAPKRVQIAEERIANYAIISPTELSLQGRQVGTTVLTLWFADMKDPAKQKVLSYLVRVLPDPELKERLDRVYKALEEEINRAFPDSLVHLTLVGDKLVVSGQAKDIAEATQILRVVRANAPPEDVARIPVDQVNLVLTPAETDETITPGQALENFLVRGSPRIINLLRVPGEQQVSLHVVVAEVSRSALRSIGTNFFFLNKQGQTVFGSSVGQIATGAMNLPTTLGRTAATSLNNLNASIDHGELTLALSALRRLNYAKMLAEPTLTAMNGHPANFRAGGEFPVPIVTGFTAAGLQGVSFINFGVQLTFTPFITDKDRVRLTVAADVSERDNVGGATINGAQVPSLTTRNFLTTVELRQGQTLAVAGLVQNTLNATGQRVPFFGDLPFIGRLAAFDQITADETELVILVTPELVHPLEHNELGPVPGADLFEPSDIEFFLLGRLESHHGDDYRSPARTDLNRMRQYRRSESVFIRGPHGHCDNP